MNIIKSYNCRIIRIHYSICAHKKLGNLLTRENEKTHTKMKNKINTFLQVDTAAAKSASIHIKNNNKQSHIPCVRL